ncbi:hypothetical protein [Trichormus variabilis]
MARIQDESIRKELLEDAIAYNLSLSTVETLYATSLHHLFSATS